MQELFCSSWAPKGLLFTDMVNDRLLLSSAIYMINCDKEVQPAHVISSPPTPINVPKELWHRWESCLKYFPELC